MNKIAMKGVIAALLILLYNVWVFIVGSEFVLTFWISYAFTMIAALMAAFVLVYAVNDKPILLRTALATETVLYVIVQLVVGHVSKLVLWLFPSRAFLLQFAVLVIYAVVIVFTIMHNSQIKDQQQIRGREQMNFRFILEQMKAAMGKMEYSNPQRKLVVHAYDSLASGQTASNPEAAEIEQQILSAIENLSGSIAVNDSEAIAQGCSNIENLAAARKQKLSMMNPF